MEPVRLLPNSAPSRANIRARTAVGLFAVVATIVAMLTAPSSAAAFEYPPVNDMAPPPCPYVYTSSVTLKSPVYGYSNCYLTPSTVYLGSDGVSNVSAAYKTASPIFSTVPLRAQNGRAVADYVLTLHQPGNLANTLGLGCPPPDPNEYHPTSSFGQWRAYVRTAIDSNQSIFGLPQSLALIPHPETCSATNTVNTTPTVKTYTVSANGFAGSITQQWVSYNAVRIQYDMPLSLYTAEQYFLIGASGKDGLYHVVLRLPKLADATPTAACGAAPTGSPGQYRFWSRSTDPSGLVPLSIFEYPGQETQTGGATYTFAEPRRHVVTMTVVGTDRTVTLDCAVDVPLPKLTAAIEFVDAELPLDPEEPVDVRVHVTGKWEEGAVGPITAIKFTDTATPKFGGIVSRTPAPSGDGQFTGSAVSLVPTDGFTLTPASAVTRTRAFTTTLEPSAIGRFTLQSKFGGSVTGVGPSGTGTANYSVGTAVATAPGEIGEALDVDISLNPPEGPASGQDELTGEAPEPIDVTATIRFTNRSGERMTSVRLEDIRAISASRTQEAVASFDFPRIGGAAIPTPPGYLEVVPEGGLADGDYVERTYVFQARDDLDAKFEVMASATRESDAIDIGAARERWKLKPKKLLEVRTDIKTPAAASILLPAGDLFRFKGTVKNLSTTDTLTVGPLYPEVGGATGLMSFVWDTAGSEPEAFEPSAPITLKPKQSKDFTVRITTGWSDPSTIDPATGEHNPNSTDNHSGGTAAAVKFTPWARATDQDAVTRDVEAEEISTFDAELEYDLHIDDSITIPEMDPAVFAGAIMYGGAKGAMNGAKSVILAPTDVLVLSYTSIRALASYQDVVWKNFTEEEKAAFAKDVAFMTVTVLQRNAEHAAMVPSELFDQAYEATRQKMEAQSNAWETGDWSSVVEEYSAVAGDQLTQVMMPIAAAKLVKSPLAVKAIKRAQAALQATFEERIGFKLASLERIEELGPLLDDIKSGTELAPGQLETLYGISPEELAELQRISTKYNFLLTVRARHTSSLKWIRDRGAMMKPEALKVKSVSDLDVKLGYHPDDVGQLVFRKPPAMAEWEALGPNPPELATFAEAYIDSNYAGAFTNVGERAEAAERLALRMKEWKKHELDYKRASKIGPGQPGHGFLDVSFNYKGNAISDATRKGTGKYVGFKMKKISGPGQPEAYQMLLQDARTGHFVPITGDIDPLAFTHLDGSPLSEAEHADLLDDMIKSPLLRAQHPESATFKPVPKPNGPPGPPHDGVAFVKSQTDPLEAALQIAPGNAAPRAVRLNTELSDWISPFNYHLHWDGGFIYSGTYHPRGSRPVPTTNWAEVAEAEYQQAATRKASKIAPSDGESPSIGVCKVTYSTAAAAMVLTADGKIARVVGGTGGVPATLEVDEAATAGCFTDGVSAAASTLKGLVISPTSALINDTYQGETRLPVDQTGGAAQPGGPTGLSVGQEIVIGAGTDHAENATIAGFGSILVTEPLKYAHEAGEAIVVTRTPPPAVTTIITPPAATPAPKVKPKLKAPKFAPKVTGIMKVGKTLTCGKGTWTGTAPFTYTYVWQYKKVVKRKTKWIAIKKATKGTYKLAKGDRKRTLRCGVTAKNAAGKAIAYSAATKAVK